MVCPKCGGKISVRDVVHDASQNESYRRKKCSSCGYEFYTTESQTERTSEFLKTWSEKHRNNIKE